VVINLLRATVLTWRCRLVLMISSCGRGVLNVLYWRWVSAHY